MSVWVFVGPNFSGTQNNGKPVLYALKSQKSYLGYWQNELDISFI
jgi:hypothetical protein